MKQVIPFETAIDLLEADHKAVKQLFIDYSALCEDDAPAAAKRSVAERICQELTVHAQIEEELFYPAVREAIELLPQRGIEADYMRIRGFPFGEDVEAFLNDHDVNFIVEQNRDAQLRSLLVLETNVAKSKLRSLLAFGGFPLSAKNVIDGISEQWGS